MRRYPSYPEQVNDLLDFAREVRRFEARYREDVDSTDILQHVTGFASDWTLGLLDILLDHEEWQARFVAMWRKWRRHHFLHPRRTRK